MSRSDRSTRWLGLVLVACGVLWIVDMTTGFDVPWEYVLPGTLIVLGLLFVIVGSGGDDDTPPSQFERDDAPRVP